MVINICLSPCFSREQINVETMCKKWRKAPSQPGPGHVILRGEVSDNESFENKSPFPRAIAIKEGAIHVYQEGRCDVTINCKVCHIIIKFNEPPPLSPSWHPSDCVNVLQPRSQPIRGQDATPWPIRCQDPGAGWGGCWPLPNPILWWPGQVAAPVSQQPPLTPFLSNCHRPWLFTTWAPISW